MRQTIAFYDEGMITGSFERLRHTFKNACAVVRNRGSFPMHQFWGAHDFAAENFADALVTEANAKQRNVWPEFTDDVATDSRVARPARSRRDADAFWNKLSNVSRIKRIVAFDQNVRAQLAENLREVVGERIVIIDQEEFQHVIFFARAIAARTAIALRSVSSRSRNGSESATIPAPACTNALPFFKTTERSAMQLSQFPSKPNQPTAPAEKPRRTFSSSAMICMARIFGVPETVPAGKVARKASKAVKPSRNRASTCETMCMTWL